MQSDGERLPGRLTSIGSSTSAMMCASHALVATSRSGAMMRSEYMSIAMAVRCVWSSASVLMVIGTTLPTTLDSTLRLSRVGTAIGHLLLLGLFEEPRHVLLGVLLLVEVA